MENLAGIQGSNQNRKLPAKVKIGYGVTGFAAINTFSIFIMYGMYFFTDTVGLNAAFAGIVLAIGTLWDAITDPLVGMLSDRRDPKKGRRRPFMKYVALPFGLVGWLLFTNWNLGPIATKVYFILMAVLFYTVQTLLDVPYTALGAEMTKDYDERSSLFSKRNFFATISGIFSSVVLSFVFFFSEMFGGNDSIGWSITAAICSVIAFVSIMIGYKSTKGYELTDNVGHAKGSHDLVWKDILTNKPFMFTVGLFMTSILSLSVQNSAFIYYLEYNLGLSYNEITIAFLASWVPGLLFVGMIDKLCQKYSKKFAWIVSMIIWGLSLIVFPLIIFNYVVNIWLILLMQAMAGFGLVAQYQVAWSMIPDVIEVDEFKTGLRREGIYYGLVTFLQKAATAVAVMISGLVLTRIGYNADITPTPEVLTGIKYLISLGGTVFLILSCLLAFLNPMSRERHEALKEGIKAKKLGLKVDTSPFKELL